MSPETMSVPSKSRSSTRSKSRSRSRSRSRFVQSPAKTPLRKDSVSRETTPGPGDSITTAGEPNSTVKETTGLLIAPSSSSGEVNGTDTDKTQPEKNVSSVSIFAYCNLSER